MSMDKKDKVIKALEFCTNPKVVDTCYGECPYAVADDDYRCRDMKLDALTLLKEQEAEYEKGFNDAMLRKQELMYEDTDGKWHKKDW